MTYQPSHRKPREPRWHDRPRAWLTAAGAFILGWLRRDWYEEDRELADDNGEPIGDLFGACPECGIDRGLHKGTCSAVGGVGERPVFRAARLGDGTLLPVDGEPSPPGYNPAWAPCWARQDVRRPEPRLPRESGSVVDIGLGPGYRQNVPDALASRLRGRLHANLAPCNDPGCACDCIRWTGRHDKDGYGRIYVGGRRHTGVHRLAWQIEVGPIPDGLVLDHVLSRGCVHRDCVKIDHLEPVTVRVNSLRGNTLNAMNAAKTACHLGHPFDLANTYWRPGGKRDCRICKRDRQRRAAAARQEAGTAVASFSDPPEKPGHLTMFDITHVPYPWPPPRTWSAILSGPRIRPELRTPLPAGAA